MRAIDTNILVRLMARDAARQTAAAESFVAGGAWVSVLSLAEAVWILDSVYGRSSEDVARAIEMLLVHRDLVVQDADAVRAALELFRAKPALGFSDCLTLELARKAGHVPLGTCDRNLGRVAGAQRL